MHRAPGRSAAGGTRGASPGRGVRPRRGSLHVAWTAFLGSVLVLGVLVGLLLYDPARPPAPGQEPLLLYCAAGIKAPVEAVARQYEEEYGVPVQLQFGGSQTLLANIEVSQRGDLYLPADDSYLALARDKHLVAESIPLARMTPVLAVPRGNPKQITSIGDLLARRDIRFAQANPDATAVGKLTREALEWGGQWDQLQARTIVFKPTVQDVATDIKVGTVDAGIVWDATVRQFPELEAVHLPPLDPVTANISVAVLRASTQPTAALRFARYLGARDRGLPAFERHGYRVVQGDAWALVPQLRFLAGAMLRPAVEETITHFEEREGVRVSRIYNGCGILVAQMRAGEHPDAFFACDRSFLTQVHDLFLDAVDVSTNQLVLLVPRGNPHGLRTLGDLGKPGLRVGIGHEKQCALGVLTQTTLVETGLQLRVMKNVVAQFPTGDMLVNQLRAGALDAVVAYLSNAAGFADELEALKIDVPCALAVQPLARGKETPYPQLTGRLLEALRSRASRERFEALGFHWHTSAP